MIINEFSKFLINLQFNDIPEESIEKAKLCFLDYFSVCNRGLNEESSKILIKSLTEFTNYDKSLLNNGLIRGVAAHSLDLDDGHRLAFLHPGVIVFSTALAIIQDEKLKREYNFSSKDFFESVITGYEIAVVLGKLVNPNHRNQGFHSTGTIGTFVAGAVASKLLKLDLNQTNNCLALCGTQAAGLLESDHGGSMGKALHAGKSVYNGLLSAILAKNGFTGAETIIEGDEGFLKSMASNLDFENFDFERFLDENLGKFHINEVYLKKYPFCRHIHSAIDSILYLRGQLLKSDESIDFALDLIDEIKVETYKIASEHNDYNPKTKEALKQSLPYAIAIYLVCGDLDLDKINNLINKGLLDDDLNNLNSDAGNLNSNSNNLNLNNSNEEIILIKEISKKVKIYLNSELEKLTPNKRSSKIIINFSKDYAFGFDFDEDLEKTVYYPLGESENPLEWRDILDKFSNLNPNYDINKLEIIKDMENKNMYDVLKRLI